jgi:hypothetical protein
MGFILSILGFGKAAVKWAFDNWRITVPILAVVITFFWTKEHYYTQGREDCRVEWEKKVTAETLKNEKLSEKLIDNSIKFGEHTEKDNNERKEKETSTQTRIETIIEKPIYQECKVDSEVLTGQNDLKEALK